MEESVESAQAIAEPERETESLEQLVSSYNATENHEVDWDKELKQLVSSYNAGSKEASVEGALAIIYHENKETGQVEFYLETKHPNYPRPFEKYQGKKALVGGVIDPTDKNAHSALIRELNEEIQGKGASILERIARENPKPIYTVESKDDDGLLVRNYVFKLEIVKEEDWEIIRNSKMTNDAGYMTILTLEDIKKSNNDDWAFNHYSMISRFINENYRAK